MSRFSISCSQPVGCPDEVEKVGVLGSLLSHVRVLWWEGLGEVGDGLAGSKVELPVDLEVEDVAAPPILERLLRVPEPRWLIREPVEQELVLPLRQLCSAALHN
jgi:hypothetical protein